jgi:hypothetical protein
MPDPHSFAAPQDPPRLFFVVQVPSKQKPVDAQSVSAEQDVPQLACVPSQRAGAQLGVPGVFAAATVQVPFRLAPRENAQTSQEPSQAVSQQKPSAQFPEPHCFASVQAMPVENCGSH